MDPPPEEAEVSELATADAPPTLKQYNTIVGYYANFLKTKGAQNDRQIEIFVRELKKRPIVLTRRTRLLYKGNYVVNPQRFEKLIDCFYDMAKA